MGSSPPTIFHVTHWKAGSQWIHEILRATVSDRLVPPAVDMNQFLDQPIREGSVYPTVYATRQQFEAVSLPRRWRRFVVIRDLRDTLISGYFSIKVSHREAFLADPVTEFRERLNQLSFEDGLIEVMDEWLPDSARIQESWLEVGEPLVRYEDLLERDLEILERVLIGECEAPITSQRLRQVVANTRFEKLAGGRRPGQEDVNAHWRKGIAGDWRNHFTDGVKDAFKQRWGYLLIAAGYEQGLSW